MTTSEQLEREAEAARSRIAADLDELRGRITPGQVVDQLVDYVRDGSGATFVRNFRRQIVANPVPVTLVGAGLAWLAMASRSPDWTGGDSGLARAARAAGERMAEAGRGLRDKAAAARDQAAATAHEWTDRAQESATETGQDWRASAAAARDEAGGAARQWTDSTSDVANDWTDRTRSTASEWADQTRAAASRFGERAGETGTRLQEGAATAASAFNQAASSAYGAAARGSRQGAEMFGRAADTLSETAAAGSRSIMGLFKEQPLILAGVGLAIGALLGASMPGTETEDRLMGEASDAAKSEAKEFAERQVDKGKAAAQEAWSAASRELAPETGERGHADDMSSAGAASADQPSAHSAHEAPLVPSHESGVMETESHDVSGDGKPAE